MPRTTTTADHLSQFAARLRRLARRILEKELNAAAFAAAAVRVQTQGYRLGPLSRNILAILDQAAGPLAVQEIHRRVGPAVPYGVVAAAVGRLHRHYRLVVRTAHGCYTTLPACRPNP